MKFDATNIEIHVLHTYTLERHCCSSSSTYYMAEGQTDSFGEIEVSSSMALDHFPDRYLDEINSLFKSAASAQHRV